jgi:RNA polymerase sigma-70 factor (ECF subfamily)
VQEFQAFYQEHIGLIYRFVFSKVGNREEAEDLTSQIFMKAVRGMDTERGTLSMQKWLFQVARTTIADYWRSHYRVSTSSLDELLDAGWEGPAMADQAAMNGAGEQPGEIVQRILQALPEHYREVLTCRFLLNLSIRETADRMGLTEANVKVLQFRALKRASDLEDFVVGLL